MKKFFIILFISITSTVMGGCLNLASIFPIPNVAPVIISEPIITATEDQLYSYQLEAKDPDGDSPTYLLVLRPEGMSIDSESGLISWTPTNNQVGIQQVVVEISDGKQSDTQRFEIEVINVNNLPKILSYSPTNTNIEINEGSSVILEIKTQDIDLNTTLSYQWFSNGILISSTTDSGNVSKSSWTYSTSYGDYSQKIVKVVVSDGELEDCVQWNITINDTSPPTQPALNTITSPTNISPQTLSGAKEPNTSIWINGTEVISINPDTTWSYAFDLSEGGNNVSITSRDASGNESTAVTTDIILDTIAPETPTLNAVISPTNISSQTLSGTKDTNSSILINGVEVISINLSITWSYSYNLSEGTNNISITSRDTIGNESLSTTAVIVLDTDVPGAPTLDAVTSLTNVSPQTLFGTKESNTSIWINGTEVISINPDITWSYAFDLSEGTNNISITSRDTIGNESTAVTTDIILDTIAPETPTLNAVISPTNISSQTLSGTKDTNSSILINGVEVISINSSVTWSYSYNLSEGTNNISITSRDAAGNESTALTTTIEYDPNIYVDAANTTGIEDGTKTYPFDTIAEGIDAVASGKSVMVTAGIYNEQLIINKEITLQGTSQENTFITGSSLTENLISLEADNITISSFTIDGDSSISVGIYFDNCSFININNDVIQNNIDYGIRYSNSNPTIEYNDIKNNISSGIDISAGGAGAIRDNSLINNRYGIRSYADSSPEITRNNISNNKTGIYCRGSATPIISYNTISNNTGYGIFIDDLLGNSVNPDIGGGDGKSDGYNKIIGNSTHGVSNETIHNIMAKNNWWGDTCGPKYPENPDNASLSSDWAYWDKTGGDIIFTPHLTTEP